MNQPSKQSINRQYDKLIKECLAESLSAILTHALHINAQSTVLLDSKLQITEEREADFLVEVTASTDQHFLLHLEFQSTNDTEMSFRMLRYWLFIMQQYGKVSQDIRQYVIYIGKSPMNMANTLSHDRLQYSCSLIDIRTVPAESFLTSDQPTEIILAVLCAYRDKDLLVDKILRRLKETVVEELRLSGQLGIFSQLRNLQSTVYQKRAAMSIIFDIEKDPVYQQGEKRGEKLGERRGELQRASAIARAMKQAGEPIEKIAAYTQLDQEEIKKL